MDWCCNPLMDIGCSGKPWSCCKVSQLAATVPGYLMVDLCHFLTWPIEWTVRTVNLTASRIYPYFCPGFPCFHLLTSNPLADAVSWPFLSRFISEVFWKVPFSIVLRLWILPFVLCAESLLQGWISWGAFYLLAVTFCSAPTFHTLLGSALGCRGRL